MDNIAEIKVTYKTSKRIKERITSCRKAYEIIINSWLPGTLELQEEFKVLILNRSNEVLGIYELSKGGVTGTVVDVRLIFAVALKCNATGIIITHNHPSGNLKPSEADILITNKIKNASEFLDIPLIDHIIVTKGGFYSFASEGKL